VQPLSERGLPTALINGVFPSLWSHGSINP
jgi:hypothetical protein